MKLYTYGVPVQDDLMFLNARSRYNYRIVATIEGVDLMTPAEIEATFREMGIPENAVCVCVEEI